MILAAPKATDYKDAQRPYWDSVYTSYGLSVPDHTRARDRTISSNWSDDNRATETRTTKIESRDRSTSDSSKSVWSDDKRVRDAMGKTDETIRGTVRRITPDRLGASFNGQYVVDVDANGKVTRMIVGPEAALASSNAALKDGDEVIAKGRLVTMDGTTYFVPFSVETNGTTTTLRDNEGKPVWR